MSDRHRLPNRRRCETFQLEHAELIYTVSFGRFDSGEISEVFVNNHRTNSGADTAARDAGIILSFALQHGADIDAIRRALSRNADGTANGVIGAVLDQIAKAS
jgi:hypothetical protein